MGQTISRNVCNKVTGQCIGSSQDIQQAILKHGDDSLHLYGSEQQCLKNCGGYKLSPTSISQFSYESIVALILIVSLVIYFLYRMYRH